MAKPSRPQTLSNMTGGINRFVQEADRNQAVEGENVVNDGSTLRRRDAFHAFTHAYPHILPAGQVYVKYYVYSSQTWGNYSTRKIGSASKQSFGVDPGKLRLFIGCDTQFQGIHWAYYLPGLNSDSTPNFIRIRFVTSDWVNSSTFPISDIGLYETCKYVLDSTKQAAGDLTSNASKVQPLARDGFLSWHKNSQPSAWDTKTTVNGVSAYWVILDMSEEPQTPDSTSDTDYVGTWPSTSVNFQLKAPGFRCFTLQPVTGLYSFHNRLDSTLLSASATSAPRGQETGGVQLGSWEVSKPVSRVGLLKDEGAGFSGTYDTSGWSDTGWTGGSIGPGAGLVSKNDTSYDWRSGKSNLTNRGSWGFPLLHAGITSLTNRTTTGFSFTLSNSIDNEFEDCLVFCSDVGSGSIIQNHQSRVTSSTVSGSTVTLTLSPALAVAPASDAVFSIFGIPHYAIIENALYNGNLDSTVGINTTPPEYEINTNSSSSTHIIDVDVDSSNGAFIGDRYDIDDYYDGVDAPIYFRICRESRYELPSNPYPSYAFDEVTRQYIFAFGSYPLQKFDGKSMRKLRALSNSTDLIVEQWTGFIAEKTAGSEEDPSFVKNAVLRSEPPMGRYVAFFANRLFVSGFDEDPARIVYSAPGSYNDIWPKGYETMVRDPQGSPIVGLSVLNDELVAFTPTSIYAATAPDELGYTSMQPRSFGVGFINHNVVCKAVIGGASVLLGANSDGIYAYTGAEPRIVLDEWERLLPGGVNSSTLYKSCAVVSYYENAYYLAVPSPTANFPDKLIRYCWEDKTMYVWSAPFGGISSMAAVRDESGNESLVFGHVDGTISELVPNLSDDGETITGTARTAVFTSGGLTMAVKGYMVTMEDTGGSSTETVSMIQYLNEDESAATTVYSGSLDGGTAEVDSFTLDTDSLGGKTGKKKTKKVNAKSGTRAESVQLEVSGTGRWKLRNIELLLSGLGQRSK